MDENFNTSPKHTFQKSKLQIGSSIYKKSFILDENVFHKSDIPIKSKLSKLEVVNKLNLTPQERLNQFNNSTFTKSDKNGKVHASWDEEFSLMQKKNLDYNQELKKFNKSQKLNYLLTDSNLQRPPDFAYPIITNQKHNIYPPELTVSSFNPSSTSNVKKLHNEWNSSSSFSARELPPVSRKNEQIKDYLTPAQAEARFLEGKRAQKEMIRRQEELLLAQKKKPDDTYYHFKEAKYYSEVDAENHAERMRGLSESYNPTTLNAYLNCLVPKSENLHHSDTIPHSTVFDSLRPFTTNNSQSQSFQTSISKPLPRVTKSATVRSNIIRNYLHLGSWSKVPSSEDEYAWSCCLSGDKYSRGCSLQVDNRDRWNYTNPTN